MRQLLIGLCCGFLLGFLMTRPLPSPKQPVSAPVPTITAEQAQGRLSAAEAILSVVEKSRRKIPLSETLPPIDALIQEAGQQLQQARKFGQQQRFAETYAAATASIQAAEQARILIERWQPNP